jgi:hypothetical protein
MTEKAMATETAMVTDSNNNNSQQQRIVLCKYNKYPTTKVNNKVIVHTYLPAQIPLADF